MNIHTPPCFTSPRRAATLALICVLALTGCMTSPYNGEDAGKSTDPVQFYGYVHNPGQKVTIQARRKASDAWTTIGTVNSLPGVVYYGGIAMYFWSIKKVVPGALWEHHAIGTENSGLHQHRSCFVRAVSAGNATSTFAVDNVEMLLDPEVSAEEQWEEYGYSNFVRIVSDVSSTDPQPAP